MSGRPYAATTEGARSRLRFTKSSDNTAVCPRKPRPSSPSCNWPRDADRSGGRRRAVGALGELRRALRSVDFLDGVAALGLGYMAEVSVDTRSGRSGRQPLCPAPSRGWRPEP